MFSFLIQLSRRWTPRRPGVSASSACHDRRLSVARWVTPYGREAHWFSANTAALPLLSSAEAVAGALVGDGHIFGEKLRECSLLKKNKTVFGWGMLSMGVNYTVHYTVILFIFYWGLSHSNWEILWKKGGFKGVNCEQWRLQDDWSSLLLVSWVSNDLMEPHLSRIHILNYDIYYLDEFTKHLGVFTLCLIATGFSPLRSRSRNREVGGLDGW